MLINKIYGVKRNDLGSLALTYRNFSNGEIKELVISEDNCFSVVNNIRDARVRLAKDGSTLLVEGIIKLYRLNKMNKCMSIIESEINDRGWTVPVVKNSKRLVK